MPKFTPLALIIAFLFRQRPSLRRKNYLLLTLSSFKRFLAVAISWPSVLIRCG